LSACKRLMLGNSTSSVKEGGGKMIIKREE
jgi:hypothetical protein